MIELNKSHFRSPDEVFTMAGTPSITVFAIKCIALYDYQWDVNVNACLCVCMCVTQLLNNSSVCVCVCVF